MQYLYYRDGKTLWSVDMIQMATLVYKVRSRCGDHFILFKAVLLSLDLEGEPDWGDIDDAEGTDEGGSKELQGRYENS